MEEVRDFIRSLVSNNRLFRIFSTKGPKSCEDILQKGRNSIFDDMEDFDPVDVPGEQSVADLTGQIARNDSNRYAAAQGGFADIYRGVWKSQEVAIKVLRFSINDEDAQVKWNKRLRRELLIWQQLDHPNILPLFGITSDFGPFAGMVGPWMANGNLNCYLTKVWRGFTTSDYFRILQDVSAGLSHLHLCSVIHGDLTGSNILIDAGGKAQLSDFGLSKIMADFTNSIYFTSTVGGSVRWAALELHRGDAEGPPTLTFECDIYSFGSIVLQVLSGAVPYRHLTLHQVMRKLGEGRHPSRPKEPPIADDDWHFMTRCWGDPQTRPTNVEISEYIHDRLQDKKPPKEDGLDDFGWLRRVL